MRIELRSTFEIIIPDQRIYEVDARGGTVNIVHGNQINFNSGVAVTNVPLSTKNQPVVVNFYSLVDAFLSDFPTKVKRRIR